MRIIKKIFLLILPGLFCLQASSQINSIGSPFIYNYTRGHYKAGSQSWAIEQGSNGMMYFANNNGLLEFDGDYWNVYALPNNSLLRSIRMGTENLLYAGGFNELGYYVLNDMGGAKYHSLTDLLPIADRDFGEVWRIYKHSDGVVFQTYSQLMFYAGDTIKIIKAPSSFHFSFLVNNELYVNDLKVGLMQYTEGNLHPLTGLENLRGKEIWGVLSMDNGLLIATASEGVFFYDGQSIVPWENQSFQFLKNNQIYSLVRLDKNLLAFGTIQNGLLICDNKGNPLHHINTENGLQSNTILCIGKDGFGNVWLGTNLGIDYIEVNSPLSLLSSDYGFSTGYTVIEFNEKLYFGTNQGLFAMDINKIQSNEIRSKKSSLIPETQGQVWSLTEIDGSLFCGHNNGTFLIDGISAEKISDIPGGWSFAQTPDNPLKIIGGNYSGVALYQKKNNKWVLSKQLKGFTESSRTIAFDTDHTLWMAHGYKGVFHLFFNPAYDSILKVEFYNSENSSLSSSVVSLAKINGKIVFVTLQEVYHFSSDKNDFTNDNRLNTYLKGNNIRSIQQDKSGNIWYFSDDNCGVLRLREDGNYSNINLPFRPINDKFVKGFEFVYSLDNENVFFGAENGFIHYDPSVSKNYTYPFRTYIKSMRSYNPDSVYLMDEVTNKPIVIDYSNNDVEFVFAANDFENPGEILFSTFLEGYDEKWSDWQLRISRDYTNLNEGEYTFRVKAKNIYGTITDEAGVEFKVLPPFHRTLFAFFLYGLGLLLLLILFIWAVKKRYKRAKARSQLRQEENFRKKEELLKRETLEAEKQLIRMRNEKLREDIKQKDKELANSTMQTLQKNKMLITLRDELKKLAGHSKDEGHKHEASRLVRKINKEIDDESQWNIFETHFESVHEELLTRLKTAYPDLTPSELKLCAYLRMNISSKEISVLMNISTRGVEISRYRLRKKLNLSRETNLTDFILSF